MPKANEIVLRLKAENKQLKAKLKESQQKVNKFSDKSSRLFSDLKSKIGILAGVGGILALVRGFKALIAITDKQQKAEAQLNAVLESTQHAAGLSAEEIKKMAAELQKVTTFGDEVIIAGQNLLLTFTKIGKDVFPQATETLLDMSQALGQDLKQSAILLGKALNDPIQGLTALRRVGVDLAPANKALIKQFVKTNQIGEAQKIILQELNIQMGGSARAARQTLGGAMTALSNRMGDVIETVGKKLQPSLMRLITAWQNAGEGASLFGGIMGGIAGIIGKTADAFADFINLMNLGFGKIKIQVFSDQLGIIDSQLQSLKKDEIVNSEKIKELEQIRLGIITKIGNAKLQENKVVRLIEDSAKRKLGIEIEENKIIKDKNKLKNIGLDIDKKDEDVIKKRKQEEKDRRDLLKFLGEEDVIEEEEILKKKNELQKKFADEEVKIEEEAMKKIAQLRIKQFEERWQDVNTFLSGFAQLGSMLTEVHNLNTQNRIAALENERLERQGIIEDTVSDEEERNTQIEALNNEFDRKKKLAEIRAARTAKKLAIFETLVNIPSAAFSAWKSAQVLPWPLSAIVGASMAALATSLGFAKVDAIRKQPLPVLQQGRVPGDHELAFVGNNEAIINAASTRANAGLLNAINQSGGQPVGGSMTQVTSIVEVDGRELGRAMNEFRQDQSDDSGLTNFGEGRGAM